MLFFLCCLVWVAAAIFGGATQRGYSGDVFIQLLCVPLLIAAVWPALSDGDPNRHKARLALILCAATAAVTLIQVFPLPFQVWGDGGGLIPVEPGSGVKPDWPGWNRFSLTPEATWAAAVSLIVPISIFGAVMQLGFRQRQVLVKLLLGIGALSLALGFIQIAQGQKSSFRFYDITNINEAVGFFANRNHFATLLSITLLLAGAQFTSAAEASSMRGPNSRSYLWVVAAAAFFIALLAGIAVARSRAEIILATIALSGVIAIMWRGSGERSGRRRAKRFSIAAIVFGVLFVAQFGSVGILTRLEGESAEDIRSAFNRTTWETVLKTQPFGTGLGSFVPVYATVEKREHIFPEYANRAHDDFVELLLETGIIGFVLFLGFLVWFVRRSYYTWTRTGRDPSHVALERSATIVIVMILMHSLVDYPLRTTAVSTIFAFFCAILAAPSRDADVRARGKTRRAAPDERHSTPAPGFGERWGSEMDWPEGWRHPGDRNADGTA